MPADFRRVLAKALAASPMILPGCQRTPPAVAPTDDPQLAPATVAAPAPIATAEVEPGDDREGPQIRGAQFVDARHVRLVFSEPLAPTDGVNPRQFRLSTAYATVEPEGYAYVSYADIAYQAGDDDAPIVVKQLKRYADETLVGLELSRAVPAAVCEEIGDIKRDIAEQAAYYSAQQDAYEPGPRIDTGIYLHYTKRGSSGVRDLAGNALDDVGAAWALNFGAQYANLTGQDPVARLDLLVEVPCFEVAGDDYDPAYSGGYAVPGGVPGGVVGGQIPTPTKPPPKASRSLPTNKVPTKKKKAPAKPAPSKAPKPSP